jgi:protein CpxP
MKILSRTSRSPIRLFAAAIAAVTLSLGAYAAGSNAPGSSAGHGAPWHPHRGFMMMKQLDDLHARLKLTPEQEKLWQTAADTMKRDGEAERANHEKVHAQLKAMLQQPILDMDALHTAHTQVQQESARLREETASAWLAVYDALDDPQKTMVSDLFKQHFSKMESMHERWQQRHGAASGAATTNR